MFLRLGPILVLAIVSLPPASVQGQVVEQVEAEGLTSLEHEKSPGQSPELPQVVKQVIDKTNGFREAEGAPKVEVNGKLAETAQDFANFMARTDKYGHTADGKRPADRAKDHGYDYCLVSENIAYQYNSDGFATEALAAGFFEGWKNSPGHRKNMLDPDVTETGVAIARSEKTGYYYAVQMFGRPESQAIEFSIANRSRFPIDYKVGDQSFPLPPRLTRTHQLCRPSEVTFRWPGDEGQARSVRPGNGDRFVVTQDKETFQLKKE